MFASRIALSALTATVLLTIDCSTSASAQDASEKSSPSATRQVSELPLPGPELLK